MLVEVSCPCIDVVEGMADVLICAIATVKSADIEAVNDPREASALADWCSLPYDPQTSTRSHRDKEVVMNLDVCILTPRSQPFYRNCWCYLQDEHI